MSNDHVRTDKAMEEVTQLNLYEKIQAVSNEVKNIEKDMQVGSGSYSYKAVSDQSVVLRVKEAETKYRILSIPIKQELERSEIVSGKTSTSYVDIVKMTVELVNLDKPEERIQVESYGRGLDTGDKGFGKAATYARKYALLNAYKIATGEDPDQHASEKQQVPQTVNDIAKVVLSYLAKDNEYCNNTLSHFQVERPEDLGDKELQIIHRNLVKKNLV